MAPRAHVAQAHDAIDKTIVKAGTLHLGELSVWVMNDILGLRGARPLQPSRKRDGADCPAPGLSATGTVYVPAGTTALHLSGQRCPDLTVSIAKSRLHEKREDLMISIKRINYLSYSPADSGAMHQLYFWILKKCSNISKAVFIAFARQRHREAARIVSIYADDRWSDHIEQKVSEIYFSDTLPSRRN
jgi:hypothetical protein